jgi:hypothetical protein
MTGQDGRFVLPALPAGRWTVTARRLGLAEQVRTVDVRGDATADFALAPRAAIVAPGGGERHARDPAPRRGVGARSTCSTGPRCASPAPPTRRR